MVRCYHGNPLAPGPNSAFALGTAGLRGGETTQPCKHVHPVLRGFFRYLKVKVVPLESINLFLGLRGHGARGEALNGLGPKCFNKYPEFIESPFSSYVVCVFFITFENLTS